MFKHNFLLSKISFLIKNKFKYIKRDYFINTKGKIEHKKLVINQ